MRRIDSHGCVRLRMMTDGAFSFFHHLTGGGTSDMSDVATAFRRSIFLLATTSAIMLAYAEGTLLPNVLTVPLAIAAYSFTEHRQKLHLPAFGANLLALLAILFAVGEWIRGELTSDAEAVMLARLVAWTHLLIYLMWIVLFQQKQPKHYWWMFALSLLQVAVGSVLTDSGLYGFLLIVYLFGSIWTLSLFTLHAARQQLIRPRAAAATASFGKVAGRMEQETAASGLGTILQPSQIVWENNSQSWRRQRIDLRFLVGAFSTAFVSIGVAMLFFLLVPRIWIGKVPVVDPGRTAGLPLRLTGFSEEVQLGSMGQILESNERVLFVRMYDEKDNEIDVASHAQRLGYDEPLFRGAALRTYENGRWVAGRADGDPEVHEQYLSRNAVLKQEYRIRLTHTRYLFAMHPVECISIGKSDEYIMPQPFSLMLVRPGGGRKDRTYDYTAYSSRTAAASELPVLPTPGWSQNSRRFRRIVDECLELPNEEGRLSRLQSLARRVAGYAAGAPDEPSAREMARRLESYLRDSGEYAYSLDSSVIDPDDDPVEDFLFNRKQGHCEYYAAALALMLRAVDIPARLVNGFKGGGVNRLTGEYYVEQRHAHAWVEALIDDAWVTLDATPADARSESVAGLAPAVLSWDDLLNMFREQWTNGFVSMEFDKQRKNFYEPLHESALSAWDTMKGGGVREGGNRQSLRDFLSNPANWFSWQGALATAVILSAVTLMIWAVRRFWKGGGASGSSARRSRSAIEVRVDFYERFRGICRAAGLVRGEAQTEREFLIAFDSTIQPQLEAAGIQRVPAELVDSFYEVRFGGGTVDQNLQQRLETQLSALEHALAQPRATS